MMDLIRVNSCPFAVVFVGLFFCTTDVQHRAISRGFSLCRTSRRAWVSGRPSLLTNHFGCGLPGC